MKKHLFTFLFAAVLSISSLAQSTAKEWYDKGIALKKSEKYKDALQAFKKATIADANHANAWHQLGWCYNEEDMYAEAIEALKQEEKVGAADPASLHLERGYAYKGLKKYDLALEDFNAALELDDEYALAYKERGNTYFKQKEYESALYDFDKYEELATNIEDAGYYYNRGWAENDLEKYNESVKSLSKCVELDNKYADGYTELGYSYYKLNLNSEALANYRIAMQLDNNTNATPILGIGDVFYSNLKNYDSAILYYQKGLQLKKNSKTAYYRLGWCYNDKSRFSDAIEPLRQAVLLDADYTDARTELGYAYYKLDKYDDALAQFRPIMNRDWKNELSRYYAGFCYYLKGDQDNLKKMIDELTALNSTKYVETLKKYIK